MVSYSITTPWRVLDKALDKALDSLQQSIEKIEMANVDENGELTLSGTVKGGHTRATNGLATLLALIEKKHAAEEAAKTDTPPDMPRTSVRGPSQNTWSGSGNSYPFEVQTETRH